MSMRILLVIGDAVLLDATEHLARVLPLSMGMYVYNLQEVVVGWTYLHLDECATLREYPVISPSPS